MQVFDLKKLKAFPCEERDKNVFYKTKEFKARVIELSPEGEISACEMVSYVIFYVVRGSAEVTVNNKKALLTEGKCLITEPATLALKTKNGVKIMGIQIVKRKN
jgi:quercetin dioxygenase-like cupin family protein